MICRVCEQAGLSGETCLEPKACVSEHIYCIAFSCPCGATLAIGMWMSEDEALQRAAEERQHQASRAAMTALDEARKSGAAYAVIRRLERAEQAASYAE